MVHHGSHISKLGRNIMKIRVVLSEEMVFVLHEISTKLMVTHTYTYVRVYILCPYHNHRRNR